MCSILYVRSRVDGKEQAQARRKHISADTNLRTLRNRCEYNADVCRNAGLTANTKGYRAKRRHGETASVIQYLRHARSGDEHSTGTGNGRAQRGSGPQASRPAEVRMRDADGVEARDAAREGGARRKTRTTTRSRRSEQLLRTRHV